MAERFVVCNWDFLGAGDRSALETTARQISGQPPLVLDMQRMAGKDLNQAQKAANTIAQEIRDAAGNDKITFISSGLDHIHPLAHGLKKALNADWLDIRLDIDNGQSFKDYPKHAEPFQPVDCAVELKNLSVGKIGSWLSKIFNVAGRPERAAMTTVPVIPDHEKMTLQAARFTQAHPEMNENAIVILLGSYIQSNTKKEVEKIVAQGQAEERPVIFVTSPRTEKQQRKIADQLEQKYGGQPGVYFHRFSVNDPAENIYPGILAFAGDVAVTSDSLTMVSESIALGLRTHILPTMADRPAYYESLQQQNLVRLAKDGLDTNWVPSTRPDPFTEIKRAREISKSGIDNTHNAGVLPSARGWSFNNL